MAVFWHKTCGPLAQLLEHVGIKMNGGSNGVPVCEPFARGVFQLSTLSHCIPPPPINSLWSHVCHRLSPTFATCLRPTKIPVTDEPTF